MKAILYARVSTLDKQNYQRQIDDLTALVIKQGYHKKDIQVFAENMSGYKSERPK